MIGVGNTGYLPMLIAAVKALEVPEVWGDNGGRGVPHGTRCICREFGSQYSSLVFVSSDPHPGNRSGGVVEWSLLASLQRIRRWSRTKPHLISPKFTASTFVYKTSKLCTNRRVCLYINCVYNICVYNSLRVSNVCNIKTPGSKPLKIKLFSLTTE